MMRSGLARLDLVEDFWVRDGPVLQGKLLGPLTRATAGANLSAAVP